ncbi:sulfatase-like hydrolase/transferase [Adhaeribacter pallidiroseus]|uniref:Uncharacterized protein n=1 Tax=Adhaeribacter pallidiroseus TaxID=2072847 RepID=A0A369QN40_9BACT|nr:glycosyltransferase [Adhaeribacter pallidiroseus]RDC65095.1 hypothetical protein AHMF7616_03719 [Adhaeribacter pallidiroseus]
MALLYNLFEYGILVYAIALLCCYIALGIFAIAEALTYFRKSRLTDYTLLASSPYAPSVSILAPAYNEGANIVENVRSLLNIYYNQLELIIINDGSKDDSMQKLIAAYQLEQATVSYNEQLPSKQVNAIYKSTNSTHNNLVVYNEQLPTKRVRAVYKSTNPVYGKLVVIDKENGGKADALNAGINLASHQYLVCIDVDCILEQDALLKLLKPFMEESDKKVIAAGGVVRIANSCVFENGKLVEVNLPKQLLPRFQALEYIRAFLLGRMAWSRLNGLLLISGAFGAFDRKIAIEAGGYNPKTVGEDMELVVRMRRYMADRQIPYKVAFVPDPLCWTEAPASYKILGRQRNRWMRGTIETLRIHQKLFLNPRYGILGLLSYPYWFFFELLAPVIEFGGMVFFIALAIMGLINWPYFLALTAFILIFGWLFSVFAILMEVATFNQYKKRGEVGKLIFTALLEPFLFHPFVVWSSIRGIMDLVRKDTSWGEMTRQGFQGAAANAEVQPRTTYNGWTILTDYISLSACLLLFWLGLRGLDFLQTGLIHSFPESPAVVFSVAILNDLSFFLVFSLLLAPIYCLSALISTRLARITTIAIMALTTLISFGLMHYFQTALVPLGADIQSYSWQDLQQTVGASGEVNIKNGIALIGIGFAFFATFYWFSPVLRHTARWIYLAVMLIIICWLGAGLVFSNKPWINQEYAQNLSQNKLAYFVTTNYDYLFPAATESSETASNPDNEIKYVQEKQYPFLRVNGTPDVLSPFFKSTTTPPHVVIIMVEGLGRAFTQENAYLGSFTPFLDSLSHHSLYWENFLSNGGRTFAVLPSLLGSLPFGKGGFNEMQPMPEHLSLFSILKANGYNTSFYYGGNADFDNMSGFLKAQKVDNLYDIKSFPKNYPKLPSENGFTWGYGDKELYQYNVTNNRFLNQAGKPTLQVLLTVASHSPFQVNNQAHYLQLFKKRLQSLGLSETQKQERQAYAPQFASIMYADDALRSFIKNSSSLPGFENTIF